MMKKKKKAICILIILFLVACIKPAHMYYEYKQEEKRLAQDSYYTEYKLTEYEYRVMARMYHVDENPSWRDHVDMEDWPDYSYYTMEVTEGTEMVVAVLNYWLFDNFSETDREGLEKAIEYGFSAENRITVEWVMSHPKEAVAIMHGTANNGDWFSSYQRVETVYNMLTGVAADEITEMPEADSIEQIDEPTEQE